MASFISVPLKKTYEVDLVKPLKTFIKNTFTQVNPEDYNSGLTEFNKLRNAVIAKSADKHESALDVFNRYYDQLLALENKLPISENQIRVQFKWREAFDEGSFLGGKKNLAIASAAYEKVCILFNIAALQSQIAAVQSHDSNEGLKLTAKLFQQSCGIYGHLKDIVLSHVKQDPTPDINPDTLSALTALMLAQAQEAFYRKATQDKMKDAMIAKLAYQTSDLYSDAMKLMQLGSVRELWPKDWLPTVTMKQTAFHGMAEYYQSRVAQQSKSYGEEIARLQHAKELLTASQNRGGSTFLFRSEQTCVDRALDTVQKDNNLIYHDKIPDRRSLDPIGKAAVAKPAPLSQPMSAKFTDLFEKIVPLPVHEALSSFENRRSQIAGQEVGRLKNATDLLNGVLTSLNLPAALEDLSGEGVPQSLLDKAQQIQEMGGLNKLEKLMNDLPELLTRNREILNESIKVLDEEETADLTLRDQYKEKWTRTASSNLTKPMRDEAGKYKTILDTAIQADSIVHDKYNTHKNAMSLLSKPKSELESALPAACSAASLQKSSVVVKLKELIEQVSTIKAEREVTETELKDTKFDMSGKFFAALHSYGAINEEMVSVAELDRVYAPLREQVTDSLNRQELILSQIQNLNTEFCNAKASSQNGAQRDALMKELAAGFDMFMELSDNLEEGTKFYNDLTPLLVRLQSKINDFCFARKAEKEEFITDLQKFFTNTSSSSSSSQAPPLVPPRHQTGAAGQQASKASAGDSAPKPAPRAPPRPPPPTVPTPSSSGAQLAATTTTTAATAPTVPSAPQPSISSSANVPSAPQPHVSSPATAPSAPPTSSPAQQYGQPGGGYAPYQGYPAAQMPAGYNPYNPYMAYQYQQPAYPQPGQQQPPTYPQPGQQPPYQPQPGQQHPQYLLQGQPRPPYPQQGQQALPPYPQQGQQAPPPYTQGPYHQPAYPPQNNYPPLQGYQPPIGYQAYPQQHPSPPHPAFPQQYH